MFGLGPWEIGLIFVALLLVLGPTRLPEVARSLAKGIKEFRRASSEPDEPEAERVAATTGEASNEPPLAAKEKAHTSSGS